MSYTIINKFNAHYIHIKFSGPFQGKTVTWNTHFFTLQGYIDQKNIKNKTLKQFIDIQPTETGEMKLEIALNISEISNPNIQKMMIMVKQYKNLSIGRHEYN